jgi:hypothetical protein
MSKKHPTALLRVEWRPGLSVREINALHRNGRSVTLKVLSITPDELRDISKDPEAWQEGFNAGRRGLARKSEPVSAAWLTGFLEGKAKPLRSVKDER